MEIELPDFSKANLLVVGDIMLDRYWFGSFLPDRGVFENSIPIMKIDSVAECPGGAANVAMHAGSLGSSVYLVGFTGIDCESDILNNKLSINNITCDFIKVPKYSTILKLRVISENKKIFRLDFEKNFFDLDVHDELLNHVKLFFSRVNIMILSDYSKGTLKNVRELILLAKKFNIPVLVDPKGNDFLRYSGATLLTPNLLEFESVVGSCKSEKMLIDSGMKLIRDCNLSALLITRSDKGMSLLQVDKGPLHFPSYTEVVYDDTGAGDVVIAILAASLASGNDLEKSCFLSNIFAGIQIKRMRTSSMCYNDVNVGFYKSNKINFGIVCEKMLKRGIKIARKCGETVVMVSGFFNILNAGHINFFNNVKKMGDRVIVAVEDSICSFEKNVCVNLNNVNSLKSRMLSLSLLNLIDWVISFESYSELRSLVSKISPDFFVVYKE